MKIGIKKQVDVEAKTLSIYCKVADRFTASLYDQDGVELHAQDDGYVPSFMPGEHYGDYMILNIDIDTGHVTNWKIPTAESIQEWINHDED